MKRSVAAGIIALAAGGAAAPAQVQVPSQAALAVYVRPALVGEAGDTIILGYAVKVLSTSRDSLETFAVASPGVVRVVMPGAWPTWSVATRIKAVPVALWGKNQHFVAPGDSMPPLRYAARGMLDVVQYWAAPHVADDSGETVSPRARSAAADSIVSMRGASTGFTVGVGAMPADLTVGALATRLAELVDRACALGWIDNNETCGSLTAKAAASAASLRAFVSELNAQRGKHVSEMAYLLLSANARFLLARL